jgi:hypothetical protein
MGNLRTAYRILVLKAEKMISFGDVGIDARIILK